MTKFSLFLPLGLSLLSLSASFSYVLSYCLFYSDLKLRIANEITFYIHLSNFLTSSGSLVGWPGISISMLSFYSTILSSYSTIFVVKIYYVSFTIIFNYFLIKFSFSFFFVLKVQTLGNVGGKALLLISLLFHPFFGLVV